MCAALTRAGEVANARRLEASCRRAGIRTVTVDDVVSARWDSEELVDRMVVAELPTPYGAFQAVTFRERISHHLHVALVSRAQSAAGGALVSSHTECLLGSALRGTRCSCRAHLVEALERTASSGGVLLYTPRPHELRSVNPFGSCPAAAAGKNDAGTGSSGVDGTGPDEPKTLRVAGQILRDLGLRRVRWLGAGPAIGPLSSGVQIAARESYAG